MAVEPGACLQLVTTAGSADCLRLVTTADPSDYLQLVTAAAVTVVACVLIVNASGEVYASEPSGQQQPGGPNAPNVIRSKYVGRMARTCRWLIFTVGAFLAASCTTIFSAVSIAVFLHTMFTHEALKKSFIALVSLTIVAVCWISLLIVILRWRHMRDCIAPGRHFLST
jgi:hypothetical protein